MNVAHFFRNNIKPQIKKFATDSDISIYSRIREEPQIPKKCMSLKGRKRDLQEFLGSEVIEINNNKKTNLKLLVPIRLLGEGCSSKVYCVAHKKTGELYALKVLKKSEVMMKNQLDHIKNERELLNQTDNPYIIKLHHTFVDPRNVYLMEEFCHGGELFALLRKLGAFEKHIAQFYSAEIVCALDYLHQKKICYRDLKPENLLLDQSGHIKVCDLGFSKKVDDRAWTVCGTPEYIAPEIILGLGHHQAVDWWSFGVLLYEMIAGYPPFFAPSEYELYKRILDLNYQFTSDLFDEDTKDIIMAFLKPPSKRLGNLAGGSQDIKQHRFFQEIDWKKIERRQISPPYIPEISKINKEFVENFFANDKEEDPYEPIFREFEYN